MIGVVNFLMEKKTVQFKHSWLKRSLDKVQYFYSSTIFNNLSVGL